MEASDIDLDIILNLSKLEKENHSYMYIHSEGDDENVGFFSKYNGDYNDLGTAILNLMQEDDAMAEMLTNIVLTHFKTHDIMRDLKVCVDNQLNIVDGEFFTPKQVIDRVCDYFQIDEQHLKSKTRKVNIVFARYFCYYFIRLVSRASYQSIGDLFGKNHATVLHGIKTLRNETQFNRSLKHDIKELSEYFNVSIDFIK